MAAHLTVLVQMGKFHGECTQLDLVQESRSLEGPVPGRERAFVIKDLPMETAKAGLTMTANRNLREETALKEEKGRHFQLLLRVT